MECKRRMKRHVRGILFVDYIRMLRAQKDPAWRKLLEPEDAPYLDVKVDPDEWYPMATFERLGNAILEVIARGELFPVQLWGRYSATKLHQANPMLLDPDDPAETLARFRVLRETFFDFDALEVPLLHDDEAHIIIRYYMGSPAEEAATHQTMGFFEGLLELAGAKDIRASLVEKSWEGDVKTRLVIKWRLPTRR
jgi:hypothetical protein